MRPPVETGGRIGVVTGGEATSESARRCNADAGGEVTDT
jgi:hypothetical protein